MSQISKSVEELIDGVRRLMWAGDERYESVDFEDQRLRAKLTIAAKFRALTVADFDQAIAEIDRETMAEIQRSGEFSKRCHEQRDDLHVFYVYNTNDRKLTVLARDVACARHFAHIHGHIHDPKNGRAMVMKDAGEFELRKSGRALGRALRDGYPGVITQVGDSVVNEGRKKVYTPMTVVE